MDRLRHYDPSWGFDGESSKWPDIPPSVAIGTTRIKCGCGRRTTIDSRYLFDHGWTCPGCGRRIASKPELADKQRQKWRARFQGRVGRRRA